MGQKVNSNGMRIGWSKGWTDCYCSDVSKVRSTLQIIYAVKSFLSKELNIKEDISGAFHFGFINIVSIGIDLSGNINMYIECSEPKIIIGKNGEKVDSLTKKIEHNFKRNVVINVIPLTINKYLNAKYLSDFIGREIINPNSKESCKKIMKRCGALAMTSGAVGIKIILSGRLNGVEIARDEKFNAGTVPNSDIKADIDYSYSRVLTPYGIIGIRVWLHRNDNVVKGNENSSFLYNRLLNNNSKNNKKKRNN
jgi:small subunit ribosomal protein S3